MLPLGATRDAVIDVYGWPTGQSKLGAKEILSYPQGRVRLEDGRVESVNFTMKPPWPAPRPRPDWAVRLPADVKEVPPEPAVPTPEFWLNRFEDAVQEAARRKLPILALFSDTENSPASRQFDEDVAHQPEFISALNADLVFLRLDFGPREPLPVEVRARHEQLREAFGIRVYPSLRMLSPEGDMRAEFDLSKVPAGAGFRAGVVSAVLAARNHLFRPRAESADSPTQTPAGQAGTNVSAQSSALDTSLWKVRGVLQGAIALGLGLVGLLFWLVWRKWRSTPQGAPAGEMAMRISDAASGLPSQMELVTWPRSRLVALVAAFVEAEGYEAEVAPPTAECDLILRRAGNARPQLFILCAGSETGSVSARLVREFFATLTAAGLDHGWVVAPAGFAAEAKEFAAQHRVQLIDGPELTAQLRELPPLVLPKVLARAAGLAGKP